jgi:hypothetical protein
MFIRVRRNSQRWTFGGTGSTKGEYEQTVQQSSDSDGRVQRHRRWDCNGLGRCGRARSGELFLRPGRRRTRRSGDHRQRGRGDRGRGRRVQGRRCRAVIQRSAFRVRKTGRFGQQHWVFRFGAFADITEESFHLHYKINVLGAILTVQEGIKRFGADGGSISTSALSSARIRWREPCCTLPRKVPSKR